MVDLSKVSQAVQKFVADVAKTEGDKKKVDTPHEYDKLANYLANNQNNLNANEKDFIDGYMLEFTTKQKADVKNQEQGGDSVKKSANDSEPSTISGENESWQTIIKKYYPDLLKDGGNLHDAIRTLQKALCTDENGVVDETKLKNLRHSTSLPKEIKLPLELNGAKFQIVEGEVKNDYFVDDLY